MRISDIFYIFCVKKYRQMSRKTSFASEIRTMDNDNDNHNEASGSDGNNPGTDTAVSETDIQQPATTTTENFVKLKCRAFPHGVYSVGISFWSGFAWFM